MSSRLDLPGNCSTCVKGFAYALAPTTLLGGGSCVSSFPPGLSSIVCIATYMYNNTPCGDSQTYSTHCFECVCELLPTLPGIPSFVGSYLESFCKDLIPTSNQHFSGEPMQRF